MRIRIDTDACTGHGRCYTLAPELFDCDERGYGVVVASIVPEGMEGQAATAKDNCPEHAVVVED